MKAHGTVWEALRHNISEASKCIDWGAATRGIPFSCSGGPVLKTSIINLGRPTQPCLQSCSTFRYSMAECLRFDCHFKNIVAEMTSAGRHCWRGNWPARPPSYLELPAYWHGENPTYDYNCLPPSTWWNITFLALAYTMWSFYLRFNHHTRCAVDEHQAPVVGWLWHDWHLSAWWRPGTDILLYNSWKTNSKSFFLRSGHAT